MKRLSGNKIANVIIIVAIICVPLLYAGLLTWAYEDPLNRLEKIDAAIVNLDTPAQVPSVPGASDKPAEIAVGQRLSERLTHPQANEEVGFAWHAVSQAEAEAGLADGSYRAVLELPANLSQHLAELGGDHPEQVTPATIELRTDDAINYLAGTMAQTVARELESIASGKAAGEFIDTIVVSLSSVHSGLSQAADGAGELASGTAELSDGSQRLADASGELADGTGQLNAGAVELSAGSQRLANSSVQLTTGLRDLASGAVQLHQGATGLNNGSGELAGGIDRLHAGAHQAAAGSHELSGGLSRYTGGVSELAGGIDRLRDGLTTAPAPGSPSYVEASARLAEALSPGTKPASPTLADGSAQLKAGMSQFDQGLTQAGAGASKLRDGARDLRDGAHGLAAQFHHSPDPASPTLADGAQALADGAVSLNEGIGALATGAPQLKDGAASAAQFMHSLADLCTALPADPVCVTLDAGVRAQGIDGLGAMAASADALAAGAEHAASAIDKLNAGSAQLSQGATALTTHVTGAAPRVDALASGSDTLATGADQLASTLVNPDGQTLRAGFTELQAGAQRLDQAIASAGQGARSLDQALRQQIIPGLNRLANGSSQLTDSSTPLLTGAQQLADGTARLANGTDQLSARMPELRAGAERLLSGTTALLDGSQRAHGGAQQLSAGAGQLSAGAEDLAAGTERAHVGASQLASGSSELSFGIEKADDGAHRLAVELEDGAAKIPQYSNADAQKIGQVAGHPIEVDAVRTHPASHNGIGFAPFFMALALWVGAIAMYFVFPSLDMRAHPAQPWWMRALRPFGVTAILGLAQAGAVVLGLELLLDLDARNIVPLLVVVAIGSVCFVAVNQACVATLGFRGRFVSVLLLILQISSMGATFPIETAPRVLQVLSHIFPMTYVAQAIRGHVVGGGVGLGVGIIVIGLWLALAWTLTLFAAHRRSAGRPMPFDPALAFPGTPAEKATDKLSVASL